MCVIILFVTGISSGRSCQCFPVVCFTVCVCVILQQWGCWVRCACVRTDVADCAVRTCGWTPCCGRPGSAGSWFSWSPQSRPLLCLPFPPNWIKKWAPRGGSDVRFPPIQIPVTEPPSACPPDTPSQPTTGKTVCELVCDSCYYHSSRESLESSSVGEVAVQRQCPRYSLVCVAGSILQQWGRWQREHNTAQLFRCGDVGGVCCSQHCSTDNANQPLTVTGLSFSLVSPLNGLSAVQSQWSHKDSASTHHCRGSRLSAQG